MNAGSCSVSCLLFLTILHEFASLCYHTECSGQHTPFRFTLFRTSVSRPQGHTSHRRSSSESAADHSESDSDSGSSSAIVNRREPPPSTRRADGAW